MNSDRRTDGPTNGPTEWLIESRARTKTVLKKMKKKMKKSWFEKLKVEKRQKRLKWVKQVPPSAFFSTFVNFLKLFI